jgi:HEPN domain-containing protein
VTAFDAEEFHRWFDQAVHTLASAERDAIAGDFAWACFKTQQAGEYAVKALLRGLAQPAFGHAIRRLLHDVTVLALEVPDDVQEAGQLLDRHYIPTRYPDAYPEGSPHEYYTKRTAKEAIDAATRLLNWVGQTQTDAQEGV